MHTQERVSVGMSACVKITRPTVSAVSLPQLVCVCACVRGNDIPTFLPFHWELETKAEGREELLTQ